MSNEEKKFIISIYVTLDLSGLIVHVKDIILKILEWSGGNLRQIPMTHSFMAEKNCTTVSHEIVHELLRQQNHKKFVDNVHDVWTKHLFSDLYFEQYGEDFKKTDGKPMFLTMDTSDLPI